jgi:uncharacterized protein involved in cysteine biosynthesis
MFSGFVKAVGQLGDPRIRGVVMRAVLFSTLIFVALVFTVSWTLSGNEIFGIAWLDKPIALLGGSAAFIIGLLLFPAIAGLIISFMLEKIARAVEARHYPATGA